MLRFTLLLILSFIGMEFFSYLVHRFVYHKVLWFIHRSHHTPRLGRFEWNDLFPVVLAALTIMLMMTALSTNEGSDLLAVSIGMTLYGAVYLTIHDLYAHRRMKSLTFKIPYLQRVKKAHMVHHLYGGEPFGLLLFSIPKNVDMTKVPDEGVV